MFGATEVAKGITFTKVLSGLSKTLSIANQVIPIYQQAKPLIQNARGAMKLIKDFSSNSNSSTGKVSAIPLKSTVNTVSQTKKVSSTSPLKQQNSPVFFV